MIQCIILEDEYPAQQVLKKYIEKTPVLSLLGIYETGIEIPSNKLEETDLIFLDIQLPEINGLKFLRSLQTPPKVIITTAYTDYAIEAFEEAVVDYLLKPISYERFFKAVDRLRSTYFSTDTEETTFIYADKTFHKIKISEIVLIKAEVDYVKIITIKDQFLILDSLKNWNEKLAGLNFMQVHRSFIVNIDRLVKVYGNQVQMDSQDVVPIGKSYRERVERIVKS